ncbi:MAG: LysM peptidoglycan-binding domain-containing protein [Candidatus Fermentibacteraceae bacterium]
MNAGCSGIRTAQPVVRTEQGGPPPSLMHQTPVIPLIARTSGGHPSPLRIPPGLAETSDVRYNPANCQADADLRGLLERVLRSEGVPVELTALIWVESSYSLGSYSTAGAAGPWQFMGGTARSCNLHMADRVDERYSWVASTRAASRYLDYLHGMFGDWQLAIAAYNCGEGTMQRALSGGQGGLTELGLPRETSTFVPRFASALEAYSQLGESGGGLSVVIVPPGLDLRVLAAETGIDPDVLAGLNRGFLAETVPGRREGWELVVPTDKAAEAFQAAWAIEPSRYLVREGDDWNDIAQATGVAQQDLSQVNATVEPVPGTYVSLPESERTPVNTRAAEASGFYRYTVRSGDTLGGIGSEVGVSSREVAQWNDISPSATIFPGQILMLRGTPSAGSAPPPETITGGGRITHTVASGDTMWDLSRRYGVPVEQIQSLNNRSGSSLSIGEVLIIRPE